MLSDVNFFVLVNYQEINCSLVKNSLGTLDFALSAGAVSSSSQISFNFFFLSSANSKLQSSPLSLVLGVYAVDYMIL